MLRHYQWRYLVTRIVLGVLATAMLGLGGARPIHAEGPLDAQELLVERQLGCPI